MKEQIQQLIADGRTEEALAMLAQVSNDALLLQARYNNGKKQYNMGLIEFSEWQRTQAQINYAVLEMASSIKGAPAGTGTHTGTGSGSTAAHSSTGTGTGGSKPGVFISYNHKDSFAMRSVKSVLEDHGIQVFVDIKDMGVGDDIQGFIDKAFQTNQHILSIVSRNSLLSGWVNKELSATFLLSRMGSKWIPVKIDNACFDPNFYFEANEEIDKKIADSRDKMRKALDANLDTTPFQDELKRQLDLKANLGTTIDSLKKVLVVDIADGLFDSGLEKVVKAIKG